MPINLELWEIHLILSALAKLPEWEGAETMQHIQAQLENQHGSD